MTARPDDEDTRPPGAAGGGGVGPGGFGAWGKIPALGDFFHLRLGRGFVDGWDRFVQGALIAGRAALGGRWNDCYLTAPIWRFTLAPGLAGPDPAIGVMMASIDRVGRQFPLTLAAALPGGGPVLRDHFLATPAFVTLEGIALAALDERMTRDALAEALWPVEVRPPAGGATLARSPGGALVAVGGGGAGLATDLAAGLAGAGFRAPSVWSAEVAGGPRLMICEGLPGAAEAAGLFDLDAPVWRGESGAGGSTLPPPPRPDTAPPAPPPGAAPGAAPAAAPTAAAPTAATTADTGTGLGTGLEAGADDDDIMAAILADPGPAARESPRAAAEPDPEAGADLLAELLAPDDDPAADDPAADDPADTLPADDADGGDDTDDTDDDDSRRDGPPRKDAAP